MYYDENSDGSGFIWLLMAIVILFVIMGCSTPRDYKQLTDQVAEYGVQRIEDKDAICYVYRDGDWSSLSCVKKSK